MCVCVDSTSLFLRFIRVTFTYFCVPLVFISKNTNSHTYAPSKGSKRSRNQGHCCDAVKNHGDYSSQCRYGGESSPPFLSQPAATGMDNGSGLENPEKGAVVFKSKRRAMEKSEGGDVARDALRSRNMQVR